MLETTISSKIFKQLQLHHAAFVGLLTCCEPILVQSNPAIRRANCSADIVIAPFVIGGQILFHSLDNGWIYPSSVQ